jgi:hypothetical protein
VSGALQELMANAESRVVDRRRWALSLSVTVALGVGWVVMLAQRTHTEQWSFYRDSVAHYERLRAENPAAAMDVPVPAPPRVWADMLYSLDVGLPLIAAMLLGVALVAAGHRRWALVSPVLLSVSVVLEYLTLRDSLVLPTDLSGAPSLWSPWQEVVLPTVLAVLPAAAAAWASRVRPPGLSLRRVPTRVALARAAVASAAVVAAWLPLSPTQLGAGDPVALARAGAFVLVVLTTGLIAAGSSSRVLGSLVAATGVLLGIRIFARGSGVVVQYSSGFDLLYCLAIVCALALGPLAVLGAPWAGRQWVKIFRGAAGTAASL